MDVIAPKEGFWEQEGNTIEISLPLTFEFAANESHTIDNYYVSQIRALQDPLRSVAPGKAKLCALKEGEYTPLSKPITVSGRENSNTDTLHLCVSVEDGKFSPEQDYRVSLVQIFQGRHRIELQIDCTCAGDGQTHIKEVRRPKYPWVIGLNFALYVIPTTAFLVWNKSVISDVENLPYFLEAPTINAFMGFVVGFMGLQLAESIVIFQHSARLLHFFKFPELHLTSAAAVVIFKSRLMTVILLSIVSLYGYMTFQFSPVELPAVEDYQWFDEEGEVLESTRVLVSDIPSIHLGRVDCVPSIHFAHPRFEDGFLARLAGSAVATIKYSSFSHNIGDHAPFASNSLFGSNGLEEVEIQRFLSNEALKEYSCIQSINCEAGEGGECDVAFNLKTKEFLDNNEFRLLVNRVDVSTPEHSYPFDGIKEFIDRRKDSDEKPVTSQVYLNYMKDNFPKSISGNWDDNSVVFKRLTIATLYFAKLSASETPYEAKKLLTPYLEFMRGIEQRQDNSVLIPFDRKLWRSAWQILLMAEKYHSGMSGRLTREALEQYWKSTGIDLYLLLFPSCFQFDAFGPGTQYLMDFLESRNEERRFEVLGENIMRKVAEEIILTLRSVRATVTTEAERLKFNEVVNSLGDFKVLSVEELGNTLLNAQFPSQ